MAIDIEDGVTDIILELIVSDKFHLFSSIGVAKIIDLP